MKFLHGNRWREHFGVPCSPRNHLQCSLNILELLSTLIGRTEIIDDCPMCWYVGMTSQSDLTWKQQGLEISWVSQALLWWEGLYNNPMTTQRKVVVCGSTSHFLEPFATFRGHPRACDESDLLVSLTPPWKPPKTATMTPALLSAFNFLVIQSHPVPSWAQQVPQPWLSTSLVSPVNSHLGLTPWEVEHLDIPGCALLNSGYIWAPIFG
jgi:hypothetical protein